MAPASSHTPLRVLHCDDSGGVRALVSAMLQPQPDIDLVEQVDSHAGVLRRAAVLQPDLVLLDLDAGRDDQVVTDLRKACSAKVLVLSGEPDLADDPLAMQADGFVSKTTGSAAIMRELASAAAEHRRTER